MLGYVHSGQQTVILRVPFTSRKVNAWICAQSTTDRDLERVFIKRKVNAWICARHSTDRDLESVFNVNAWIRAPPTTDHDPANTHFLLKTVTPVTPVIFYSQELFSIYYQAVTPVI